MSVTFDPSDYSDFAADSAAAKLSDSAVAPLVAYTHGCRSIAAANVKSICAYLGFDARTTPARQIKKAVGDLDAMLMPWFTAGQVVVMERENIDQPPANMQLRPHPANVEFNHQGKPVKYVNLSGQKLHVGVHPAIPAAWLTERSRAVMVAEGLLKGDAALTAMALAHGIDRDDLLVTEADLNDVVAARTRLRTLLETIPAEHQVVIYEVLSVSTFFKNPEWNEIALDGQPFYIAVDGDLTVNPHVWRGAKALWDIAAKKGGIPTLVDLSNQVLPDGGKCGLDDFLGHLGDWNQLMALATTVLPARPDTLSATPGEWVMDNENHKTVSWVSDAEGDGGFWAEHYNFAARVAVAENRRSVTPEEQESGQYFGDADSDDTETRVEIEFSWMHHGQVRKGMVTGPQELLMSPPHEWRRLRGVVFSPAVAELPKFPPTERNFLTAMKANRADERIYRALWDHMGWVPVDEGSPVFVVGRQVVSADGLAPTLAACSVKNNEINGAERYGIQLPDDDDDARDALRRVLAAYYPDDIEKSPFQDRRNATIFLSAALRPCVPRRPSITVALTGHTGAGKSWASAYGIMAFWQAVPGTWSDKALPGSASDTPASAEVAVSKTPVWVVDDLAPDPDANRANRQASAVWDLVRRVHNNSARGRRQADMTAAKIHLPRAMLVVSAEQAPEDRGSIMNRLVHVNVRRRQFLSASSEPTNKIEQMSGDDAPQSKVTGYIIKMIAAYGRDHGWDALQKLIDGLYQFHVENAQRVMGTDGKRQAQKVADLALGMAALHAMMITLDMSDELEDVIDAMTLDLYSVASASYISSNEIVLGKQFLADLQSTLQSHRAHVSALGLSGAPLAPDEVGLHGNSGMAVNDQLGWTLSPGNEDNRANGPRIGVVVTDSNDELAVIFDMAAAYAAVGTYRSHTPKAVWESVVQNGLALGFGNGGWKTKTSGGGAGLVQRVTRNHTSVEGVVIPLWRLLGFDSLDDFKAVSQA